MSSVVISGDTSGAITLQAPAVSGNTTLNLPASSGTVLTQNSSAPANSFVVDASGNVGIGQSSPTQKLDIIGNVSLNRATATSYNLGGGIKFQVDGTSYAAIAQPSAQALAFYTGNDTTERMRIDSSGNVLVGTTSGTGRLNVSGLSSFNVANSSVIGNAAVVTSGSYGGGVSIIDGTQGYSLWAQTSGADFYIRRATTTGSYTGGVALINAATSWSSASDENIKDIIEPITNGLEKVSTLRTVIGKYKDEAEGIRHPFLIAQDVQKVLPEAVSILNKGEVNECLGLSYTDMIPLLVKAIQELKAIVDEQAEKIKALEAK